MPTLIALPLLLVSPWVAAPVSATPETNTRFDLVLTGGRVIDPESGLDGIRNIGIRDGRVEAIASAELEGRERIDVKGLVVAPGFIDLHTHSPTPLGQHYQVLDGVTTALELEAGSWPVNDFGKDMEDRALIHYGTSAGYGSIRVEAKLGVRSIHIPTTETQLIGWKGYWTAFRSLFTEPDEPFTEPASAQERQEMRAMLEAGIDAGGLGIGLPLDYFSEAINAEEIEMVFEVAAERSVPLFVHIRRGIDGDPSGLREALVLAESTGASLHICHIQHNAMSAIDLFLSEIREARSRGVDVTTETLPYNAGSALISSAVFGRDWQTIFAIDYEDVEWAATGERFDEEMWNRYREEFPTGQVIHHYVDESWTRRALTEPGVIVVSDLLPMIEKDSKVAPHNGAFSKVLGRYVREEQLLDLRIALSRMTLLPAARLEEAFPLFRKKGRLQVGSDADITIFDPETVLDRATYQDPYQGSAGIHYVLVAGEVVVREGVVQPDTYPGRNLSGVGTTAPGGE